ncbi:hypothetical protein BH11BAC1_BH11BAC1_20470 [soil metagenome]
MIRILTLIQLCFITMMCQAQTGIYVPQLAGFDTAMMNFINQYGVPGGQLAITYQGRLVYNRGFGYADTVAHSLVEPNSIFRLASVSKPITAVAIMKLFENGLINLDTKVFGPTGILNDAAYQTILDPRVNDITVRELLQHGGGWNRDISGDPMFNNFAIATAMGVNPPAGSVSVISYVLANKMLDFTPGTDYQYSNFGYCVLGRVIEKITGQSYEDYLLNTILHPIGITDMHLGFNLLANQLPNEVNYYDFPGALLTNSVYDNVTQVPWPYAGFNIEAMDAHGGWVASGEDMCRLLCAIDKFTTRPDILLPATIDTMIQPSAHNSTYACGIAVNTYNNWWHSGSLMGTSTEIVRAGNFALNWALLFNTRNAVSGPLETAMDNLVWSVVGSITSWPTHNLFTGIEEVTGNILFDVFPNPVSESLSITINETGSANEIKILDVLGNELYSMNAGRNSGKTLTIGTENLSDGIYFLQVFSGDKNGIKKIIVHHNR